MDLIGRDGRWGLPTPLLLGLLLLVGIAWPLVFTPAPGFWLRMAGTTFVLGALGVALGPGWRRRSWWSEAAWGVGSAAALYALFALGGVVMGWIGAGGAVRSVYGLKEGMSTSWLILLLAFPIGPGEELFWRGLVQPAMQARWGRAVGLGAGALVYALVHLCTGNPVLVLAALVCGLFWGALVELRGGLQAAVISHVLWDIAVFVLWPLAG